MLFLTTLLTTVSAGAIELTNDTFDSTVRNGKGTFVKFFAPWCGHCKRMKPDWDKLADELASSDIVQIVDVDCTAAGKDICGKVGVRGYPTVKYYLADEPNKALDYKGGRDMASLKKFVEGTFRPPCDAETKKNCSAEQVKILDSLKGKGALDVKKFIKEKEDEAKKTKSDREKYDRESKQRIKDFEKKEEELQSHAATARKLLSKGSSHDEL